MSTTKPINSYMIGWLIIQLLLFLNQTYYYLESVYSDDIYAYYFWGILLLLLLNWIGVLIIISGKPKTGSIIFLIASAIQFPIGLIGVIGARKTLDKIKYEKFTEKDKPKELTKNTGSYIE